MGMGGGYVPMILMQRRFSNVIITDTETAPTIEAGAGGGGNNLPMIMQTFNQISQSAGYKKDETSVSITVCGGSYGGQ